MRIQFLLTLGLLPTPRAISLLHDASDLRTWSLLLPHPHQRPGQFPLAMRQTYFVLTLVLWRHAQSLLVRPDTTSLLFLRSLPNVRAGRLRPQCPLGLGCPKTL